ncbi:MAG: hypothetical protein ACD_33C00045G0018 [uncultured bacterium]|nr:MAG: hypothetical protein ACD_33C00045G0018 [uncultured bacterium]
MKYKEAFDQLYKDVKFDRNLYKKILSNNIDFITKNDEYKNLFGGQLIGCYLVKYTYIDMNNFFNNVLNIDNERVEKAVDSISTINKSFKISSDSVNLTCYYIAHRFLTNKDLKEKDRIQYAEEILTYFNYRTLVVICSNYFIYPISESQALTLFEKLSNKYLIKKLKNWNEYCKYRSTEYIKSKYLSLLLKLNDDEELANAINDLFIRTKDTLKNIYKDFIDMQENDDIIKNKKNVITDVEGKEVIVDKLNTPESYYIYLEGMLSDKNNFIKDTYMDVTVNIIKNLSFNQLKELLDNMYEYMYKDKDSYNKITILYKEILINAILYLQKNEYSLHKKSNILTVMNFLVGNLLYARGTDLEINEIKDKSHKLIIDVYKKTINKKLSDKVLNNLKNGLYVYIVLRAIVES